MDHFYRLHIDVPSPTYVDITDTYYLHTPRNINLNSFSSQQVELGLRYINDYNRAIITNCETLTLDYGVSCYTKILYPLEHINVIVTNHSPEPRMIPINTPICRLDFMNTDGTIS